MNKMTTVVVALLIITAVMIVVVFEPKPTDRKKDPVVSATNDLRVMKYGLGAIYTEIETARQESAVQASNICGRLSALEVRTGGLEKNQSAIVAALKDMDKRTEIIADVLRNEVGHRVGTTTSPRPTSTNTLRGMPLFGSGVAKTGTNSSRQKVNLTVHGGQAGLMPVIIQQGGNEDQTVDITVTNNSSSMSPASPASAPVTQAPSQQKTWSSANSAPTHTDWGPQANTSPWVPQPLPEVQADPVIVVGYGYPGYHRGYGYGHSYGYSSSLNVGFRIGNGGFSRNSYYNSSRNRHSRRCL